MSTESTTKHSFLKLLSQKLKPLLTPLTSWYQSLASRERLSIIATLCVAGFIVSYLVIENTVKIFNTQSARHSELEESLGRIPPLLNRYNSLKEQRLAFDEKFRMSSGLKTPNYAYIERLIKRKAKVESSPQINKGDSITVQNQYTITPISVKFPQLTQEELSNFLKELSADDETSSIITKLSISSRGTKISVDINIDFITSV